MKAKKLLFFMTILLSISLVAQNSHQPTGTITGTFMGTTGNLKDFPLYDVNNYDSSSLTIVPQQVRIARCPSFGERTIYAQYALL